ncbi:MAG: hypothetical protein DMD78_22660, partial [Candidatus Rokuibacteriota bacterium]
IAPHSQYVLILLAVTFTWLMGLMGFARSGIRQHWHVYGVLRDNSVDAVTPALGYAANVITIVTLVFFALVMFIFRARARRRAGAGRRQRPGRLRCGSRSASRSAPSPSW